MAEARTKPGQLLGKEFFRCSKCPAKVSPNGIYMFSRLTIFFGYRHLLCDERCGSETLGRAISSGSVQNAKKGGKGH